MIVSIWNRGRQVRLIMIYDCILAAAMVGIKKGRHFITARCCDCGGYIAAINLRAQIPLHGILPPPPPLHHPLHRKANDPHAKSRRLTLHSLHRIPLPPICRRTIHFMVVVRTVPARRGIGANTSGKSRNYGGEVLSNVIERLGVLRDEIAETSVGDGTAV